MDRLQKIISDRGYCSRRKAEELILSKRVKVDGKVVSEVGCKFDSNVLIEIDDIVVDKQDKEYYVINKPRGVVTTTSDDKGRKTVIDFFSSNARLYPVGRLDYDTTGILIVTNDGEFAQMLMHPKNNIEKVYVAKISGILDIDAINKLKSGVMLDGKKTSRAKIRVKKVDKVKNTCIVQITIHEGMYHQVKRMFGAVGYQVLKLKREVYGFITVGNLKPGEYRRLTPKEIHQLYVLSEKKDN